MSSSLLLALIVFCGVVSMINGGIEYSLPDPEHPGECIFNGKKLEIGNNYIPGYCAEISCSSDGSYQIATCGKIGSTPECTLGDRIYPDQPYPKCCEVYFDCVKEDGTHYRHPK